MVIASAHWDSFVHFLHDFSPETPRWRTPMATPGKTQKVFDMWKMVSINLEHLPKNTNKNWQYPVATRLKQKLVHIYIYTYIYIHTYIYIYIYIYTFRKWSFPRFVRREVDLSFRFGGATAKNVEKIRCFIWRLNPGAILDGFASSPYLGECWMGSHWWSPASSLSRRSRYTWILAGVCNICARFFFHLFHPEKTLAILAEILLGGVILCFLQTCIWNLQHPRIKMVVPIGWWTKSVHAKWSFHRFTKHPLKICSANG